LVNDNTKLALTAATSFQENLQKVDMGLLKDDKSHTIWMPLLKELKTSSKEIATETTIKIQREHFIVLSNAITKTVEAFGVNKKIYKQFCPMANNDTGAFWLSIDEHIMNPYFGASMLKCGTIEAEIE
jgi:Cu(I)/Ag(I) efflux system membrane fusion protein